MKKTTIIMLLTAVTLGFSSCGEEDDLSPVTIFPTTSLQRDSLDNWLLKNFTYTYGVDFQYKFQDIESDMKYTLVPADSALSAKLAIIIKYLWFDAYNEVVGTDFLKGNVPRQITLIGSPAYNNDGTYVLGTAEGGYKVVLYMVNNLTDETLKDYDRMNDYYFTTMHHEFMHILNQKKPYNKTFDLISEGEYVSGDWYLRDTEKEALPAGFIRNYAMEEGREDFAETYSQFVTNSEETWAKKMDLAGKEGKAIIEEKIQMIRLYLRESWGLDIDALRQAVQHRAEEIRTLDLEHLN